MAEIRFGKQAEQIGNAHLAEMRQLSEKLNQEMRESQEQIKHDILKKLHDKFREKGTLREIEMADLKTNLLGGVASKQDEMMQMINAGASQMDRAFEGLEEQMQKHFVSTSVVLKDLTRMVQHLVAKAREEGKVSSTHEASTDKAKEKSRVKRIRKGKTPQKKSCKDGSSTSDSDEETDSEEKSSSGDESHATETASVARAPGERDIKISIPPFTGKETWKVWFTRFRDVVRRKGLGEEERLDILLPKLRGEAGTFVYDQLSSKTRSNYKILTKELETRFRKVENPKTYGAVFAGRKQKATEGVEAYAAELKKLYDKAHSKRDAKTRDEDLLRRFLDGLIDSKAGFHVEFVKNPGDIDEAVDEVVNYQEVKKKQGGTTRMVQAAENDSSEDSEASEQLIARMPGRPQKKNGKTAETSNLTPSGNHDGGGAKTVRPRCWSQRRKMSY